jgi:predicted NUDIX family NTP pyrophosphohydrolase
MLRTDVEPGNDRSVSQTYLTPSAKTVTLYPQTAEGACSPLDLCRVLRGDDAGGRAHRRLCGLTYVLREAVKSLSRMARRANVSAGLLLYRCPGDGVEVLLAHPGGPFWAQRDAGAWSIPKGLVAENEEPLAAACREFEEETGLRPTGPFIPLGSVRQKAGKLVHAWAWKGDVDPARLTSNVMRTEWPRGSGRWLSFPEIDRCAWFSLQIAREKLNMAQAAFIDRLEAQLS